MRHNLLFKKHSPINHTDDLKHMWHYKVLSSRPKAAATESALKEIFIMCRRESIKETVTENCFYMIISWSFSLR